MVDIDRPYQGADSGDEGQGDEVRSDDVAQRDVTGSAGDGEGGYREFGQARKHAHTENRHNKFLDAKFPGEGSDASNDQLGATPEHADPDSQKYYGSCHRGYPSGFRVTFTRIGIGQSFFLHRPCSVPGFCCFDPVVPVH
ncbi:MAG: hypothetical protein MZV49_23750 [Rhodopseudomonas palustris]|nr:hypothetical protein [Rhodopseudomonas palustris]